MDSGALIFMTFLGGTFSVAAIYSVLRDLYLRDREQVSNRVDEEWGQGANRWPRKSTKRHPRRRHSRV